MSAERCLNITKESFPVSWTQLLPHMNTCSHNSARSLILVFTRYKFAHVRVLIPLKFFYQYNTAIQVSFDYRKTVFTSHLVWLWRGEKWSQYKNLRIMSCCSMRDKTQIRVLYQNDLQQWGTNITSPSIPLNEPSRWWNTAITQNAKCMISARVNTASVPFFPVQISGSVFSLCDCRCSVFLMVRPLEQNLVAWAFHEAFHSETQEREFLGFSCPSHQRHHLAHVAKQRQDISC